MENLNFLEIGENRSINRINVLDLYHSIKRRGFIPEVGQIECITGDVLKHYKLRRYKVVAKDTEKAISLKNWDVDYEDVEWNESQKAIPDGQHKELAIQLLKLIDGVKFEDAVVYREVKIPKDLPIGEYIALKNSGKSWTAKDFNDSNILTEYPLIDEISRISKEEGISPQVAYDYCSFGTGNLTPNIVKGLKAKTKQLPSTVKITKGSVDNGKLILKAFKDSTFLTKGYYDNTRFSKGSKLFIKESGATVAEFVELIGKIDKTIWETYFTLKVGSAESKYYKECFKTFYEQRN